MTISIHPDAETIIQLLRQNGFEAYAVGGCVRDILLGQEPHDWDICTSATPAEMKQCFSAYKTFDTGIAHGTITVVIHHLPFEVTTYRVDGDYKDNRHPESVTFTRSLREDLARRDFTVNAMAYNEESGTVDLFGGEKDLRNKTIRCVGNPDERFNEDALRILRALRFASCYDFAIESATASAIRGNAELLRNIAVERVAAEFTKLICGGGAERILNDYREVVAVFLPELRETFDFALARAVARLNLLAELCLPFVRVGGAFLALKGPAVTEELAEAARAVEKLSAQTEEVYEYAIPGEELRHNIVVLRKTAPTPKQYPRRFAQIKKLPL